MAIVCTNPYCSSPEKGMRLPTREEIDRFRSELDRESLDRFNRNDITLQVCTTCGTWVAETWDSLHNIVVRKFIASPFKYNVGDRVEVTLEGEHYGMAGIVIRRMRCAKTIMPPPPPDNVYYIVFVDDSKEHGYGEANLTSASDNN